MSIEEKFAKTLDWLITAVVEKMEDRVPTAKETRDNVRIIKKDNRVTILWKEKPIVKAVLKKVEEGYAGYFEVDEKYIDDIIRERTNKWYEA